MEYNWICVGISGCTNGGKTTLSNALKAHFPGSTVLNQDSYFRKDDDPNHIVIQELNHKNWERLESVNWDDMLGDLNKILNSKPPLKHSILIVDGHIIFNHPILRNLFHKMYFLTLNKEDCIKRRVNRVYDPPDIPGYFEKIVWPMYLLNLKDVKKNCSEVLYLDGSEKFEEIQNIVIKDIENSLN